LPFEVRQQPLGRVDWNRDWILSRWLPPPPALSIRALIAITRPAASSDGPRPVGFAQTGPTGYCDGVRLWTWIAASRTSWTFEEWLESHASVIVAGEASVNGAANGYTTLLFLFTNNSPC
jgi:hypothetical protein